MVQHAKRPVRMRAVRVSCLLTSIQKHCECLMDLRLVVRKLHELTGKTPR